MRKKRQKWKEKEMATHSSTLAWNIPWTEEPGTLQSMGSQRVGHDWATSISLSFHMKRFHFISTIINGKNPTQGTSWGYIKILGEKQSFYKPSKMKQNSHKKNLGAFYGSPVAKTLCSQCRGPGLIPGQGTRIHMLQLRQKILCATTEPTAAKQTNKQNT